MWYYWIRSLCPLMCFVNLLFLLKIPSLLLSLHFVVLFLHILLFSRNHLNDAESLLIVIFHDQNQKLNFSDITGCIKSIHRNNFLRFFINHGYKFCNMLVLRYKTEQRSVYLCYIDRYVCHIEILQIFVL